MRSCVLSVKQDLKYINIGMNDQGCLRYILLDYGNGVTVKITNSSKQLTNLLALLTKY